MSSKKKASKSGSKKKSTKKKATKKGGSIVSKKVNKPSSPKSDPSDGSEYMQESMKPISERRSLPVGRSGRMVAPRRYAHSDDKVQEKKSAALTAGTGFINPLDRHGAYWGCIEALGELGVNEWHSHTDLYDKMEKIMSSHKNSKDISLWDKFAAREERVGANSPKDVNGRIQQNARVLQRLGGKHQYGYKLRQFCCSMDIHLEPLDDEENRDADNFPLPNTWYYKMNTTHKDSESVKPLYDNKQARKRRTSKKVDKPDKTASDTDTASDI